MDDDEQRFLGLAALLHDIGHGPFSHLSEQALLEIAESTREDDPPYNAHEKIARYLIQNDCNIARHLSDYDRNEISAIIDKTSPNQLLCQSLSGSIDADKQDYLLRDAYYCGVKYGQYDIDRLHHTIRRYPDRSGGPDSYLGIRRGGIEATEQFVQARYYMHAQVYSHSVRLCTDQMLVRAILLAVLRDDLKPIVNAFTYADDCSFANGFCYWDDLRLLQFAESADASHTKFARLMLRLRDRYLFKRIYHEEAQDIDEHRRATRDALTSTLTAATKRNIESEIAQEIGADADDVIFSTQSLEWGIKRPRETDESTLLIIDDDTMPSEFHRESLIFQSIRDSLIRTSISVYAPTDDLVEEFSSRESRARFRQEISSIIDSVLGTESQD